ncbi:MAG: serpin family protein [Gemmatimonadetes bacterium]|nr:MAG: serpin family protein [Gemmatimonadota bacterium]
MTPYPMEVIMCNILIKLNLILVVSATLLFWNCSPGSITEPPVEISTAAPELPRTLTTPEQTLLSGNTQFSFTLFRELATEHAGNILISPLSISMALAMTYNGASGETQAAMQSALELNGLSLAEMNIAYHDLIDLLQSLDPNVTFRLANSIWYRQGFSVLPDFLHRNQTYYQADIRDADFTDPQTVGRVNDWVNQRTNGTIPTVIDHIPPEAVMYLINAIYFQGEWRYRFNKNLTQTDVFYLEEGSTVPCQMMHIVEPVIMPHLYTAQAQILDLLYGNRQYSMTLILPNHNVTVDDLLAELSVEMWTAWLNELHDTELLISLPKFRLSHDLSLKAALTALGMGVAFDPMQADFRGISADDPLFISDVKHKAFIQVDESGTTAGAATAVEVGTVSLPLTFFANRPFIYLIRERQSGAILFLGRLMNPVWEG